MTNLHEHVRSQGDIHAQTSPLTSLPQGTLIEYIRVLEFGSNITDLQHAKSHVSKTVPILWKRI